MNNLVNFVESRINLHGLWALCHSVGLSCSIKYVLQVVVYRDGSQTGASSQQLYAFAMLSWSVANLISLWQKYKIPQHSLSRLWPWMQAVWNDESFIYIVLALYLSKNHSLQISRLAGWNEYDLLLIVFALYSTSHVASYAHSIASHPYIRSLLGRRITHVLQLICGSVSSGFTLNGYSALLSDTESNGLWSLNSIINRFKRLLYGNKIVLAGCVLELASGFLIARRSWLSGDLRPSALYGYFIFRRLYSSPLYRSIFHTQR